ncbi:hypothetical protein TNCV_4612841 [Trichonephila clavipes]|nr:hypothetical protein TNCV_4612841 [Trichonephila clavipes]
MFHSHLKFQDRRLESDGTKCSKTHPNEEEIWVLKRSQNSFHYWSAHSVPIGQERVRENFTELENFA